MHLYRKIYEFAASAGALEGYAYGRKNLDMKALPVWVDNLVAAYRYLPSEAIMEFQPSIDMTVGRAFRSLETVLGGEHETVLKLKTVIRGHLPDSPDDFDRKKWFQDG